MSPSWRSGRALSVLSLTSAGLSIGCGPCPPCPGGVVSPQSPSDSAPVAPVPVTSARGPRSVVRQANYLLEAGGYSLEVDPTDGGRIVAFSLGGQNVIASREESPQAYGSSFWPSPQRDWRWPPPPEMDTAPWMARTEGEAILLESRPTQKLELSAMQRIRLNGERGVATLEFVLTNRGARTRSVAPWQNTRVRPRGLIFYPSSGPALAGSSLHLEPRDGMVWFRHDPEASQQSKKSFADGQEGWVALVERDWVFVKVFPDVPREQIAPDEGEVVIYVHESGRFVEMEQQGSYVELAPGASLTWTVAWLVRRLPPGTTAEAGSHALAAFVRGLVRDVGGR